MSEFLGNINALNLADDDFCSFGNVDSREFCDCVSLLTDNLCVERAVYDDSLANLFGFIGTEEIAAASDKFLFNSVIDVLVNDNRLLGSANHTVIERF